VGGDLVLQSRRDQGPLAEDVEALIDRLQPGTLVLSPCGRRTPALRLDSLERRRPAGELAGKTADRPSTDRLGLDHRLDLVRIDRIVANDCLELRGPSPAKHEPGEILRPVLDAQRPRGQPGLHLLLADEVPRIAEVHGSGIELAIVEILAGVLGAGDAREAVSDLGLEAGPVAPVSAGGNDVGAEIPGGAYREERFIGEGHGVARRPPAPAAQASSSARPWAPLPMNASVLARPVFSGRAASG